MIARWMKAGTRGVQVSRACGFHVGATLGNVSSTSDVSGNFRRNLRRDRSTTSTAPGTAAGISSLVPIVNTGDCSDESFGGLGPVRRASRGTHRWNSKVERASSRTQLTRFSMAEYPPTSSSMQAGAPATGARPGSISRALRKLSTTSEDASKAPEGPDGEKKGDIASVAEAGIVERMESLPEEPRHSHVEMPSITDTEREAILTSWNVKVGDAIEAGDVICEIELEQFSVGVTVDTFGFVAEILVEAGSEKVPVGAPIATIVHREEDIALYQAAQETLAPASKLREKENSNDGVEDEFTWKDVLKAVLRLSQKEKLSEELASTLMSLARSKDADLLQAFEGCFEGDVYLGEIDDELFLLQAIDIAKTRRKKEAKDGEGDVSE